MLHRHRRLQKRITEINADDDQSEDDKPKLHPLRRLGCLAYRRIPKEQRIDTKMRARSKLCMMLGYVYNTTKIGEYWIQSNGKLSTAQMSNLMRIRQRIYRALIMRMMLSGFQNRSRYIPKSKLTTFRCSGSHILQIFVVLWT